MKDSILNPEFIKKELDDLEFMSSFIIYSRFGYKEKRKCKRNLKKANFQIVSLRMMVISFGNRKRI